MESFFGAPTTSAPSRRRRVIRFLAWSAAVVLVLLIAALLTLHTPPAKRYVLARVSDLLAQQNIKLQADSLDYNLLDLSVRLENATLRARRPRDAAAFARIARFELDASLLDLLRGRYVVENGTLLRPEIHLIVNNAGETNLPAPAAEAPAEEEEADAPTSLDYLIEAFRVVDGTLRYEDRRQGLDVTLPIQSIAIEGSPRTRQHDVRLRADKGRVTVQDRSADIDHVGGELTLGTDSVEVRRLELRAANSAIVLGGNVLRFADPRLDLALSANLDVGTLAPYGGLAEPIGGTLRADVKARGPLAELAVAARLNGDGLSFRDLTAVDLDVEGSYDAAASQARLARLAVQSPAGGLQAQGSVALDEKAGMSRLDAQLESLDVQRLARTLRLPYAIASRISGDVRSSWPGLAYDRAAGQARLSLTPTARSASTNVVPLAGVLVADLRGEERVDVDVRNLRGLGAAIDGRLSLLDRQDLGGSLKVQASEIAEVVSGAEAFLGQQPGTLVGTPLGGPLAVDARIGGTVDEPAVDATVDAPSLAVGEISGIALQAAARYTPAAAIIERADVAWQEARVHARGRVGLQEARAIDLDVTAEQADVAAILAALDRADIPAQGVVSLQAKADGTLDNPRATVEVKGTDLAAYGETLGQLLLETGFANQTVQLTRLRLDKPQPEELGSDAVVEARGSYQLDKGEYAFQVETDGLRLVSLTLPDKTPVRGALTLQGEGQGTLDDPAANVVLNLQDVAIGESALGDAQLDAQLANHQATLRARADRFRVDANAQLATTAPYPAKFAVVIDQLDLSTLPVDLETPLKGLVRARATGTGDLANPVDGSATVAIDQLAVTWADQPIETDGPVNLRYANRQLAIDRLIVRAQDSTVSARGMLPVDLKSNKGTLNLDARFNLATLAKYAPKDAGVAARGELGLTGTITGSLAAIDPNLTLTLQDAAVSASGLEPEVSNIAARVVVAGGALRADELHAEWGKARLDASAELPFALLPEDLPVELPRKSGPARMLVELTGLDLATIPGAPEALSGAVSLRADAQASTPDLEALTAHLTFPQLELGADQLTLAQQGTSAITVEQGQARVEQFRLEGSVGNLELAGTVGLLEPRPLDVALRGQIDAALLNAFTDALTAEGDAALEVAATGSVAKPQLKGFVELADASIQVDEPRLGLDQLDTRIDLTPTRATLTRLDGTLNGGEISGQGAVELDEGTIRDVNLQLTAKDVAFDEPMGLQSVSDADLTVVQREEQIVLGGQVTIQEAGLTDDVNLDSGIVAALTAPPTLDLTESRNPLLERLNFDVDIDTASPIFIDNNLARAEAVADLRLLGTIYDTGMSGRLTIEEESELILNERRYLVDRGIITFTSDREIEPSLDILMTTQAESYDVTLQVSGTAADTETVLTSDPSLPEPDIVAVLLTGRTLDDMRGEEYEVAQQQMLSLLSGRAAAGLGRGLERATGLSTVRLEPNLLADEANPGARLTVGQDLTSALTLLYSADLANSGDKMWIAEYDVTRQFDTRAVRTNDDTYRFDFRHDVRFGGQADPRRSQRRASRTVRSVTVKAAEPRREGPSEESGSEAPSGPTHPRSEAPLGPSITEAMVRERFKVEAGDRYDYFKVRRQVDRVEEMYEDAGLLAARVRLARNVEGDAVDLTLTITPGKRVELIYEGFSPPGKLERDIRRIWRRGVFDTQRAEDALQAVRAWFVEERYLNAQLEYEIDEGAEESSLAASASQRVAFRAKPGARFEQVRLVFEGAGGISPSELEDVVDDQGLGPKVFTAPDEVTDLLGRFYREVGYLAAELGDPTYEFDDASRLARVVIPVKEGPRFRIRRVLISGATAYKATELLSEIQLVEDDPYFPATSERSLAKIRDMYWRRGYNDVAAIYGLKVDREKGEVDVQIEIDEGPRAMVQDIQIAGTDITSQKLVSDQLEIAPDLPLDLTAVGRSRRNLYDTGAYAIADISHEPIADQAADQSTDQSTEARSAKAEGDLPSQEGGGSDGQPRTPPAQKPVRVDVSVREVQPFQVRYGASFDTERGPGAILDVSSHNSLGSARVVGVSSRYDSQLREVRLYATQPMLRTFPLATTASVYYRQERNPLADPDEPQVRDADRFGVSIQQERRLGQEWVWSYGYRFERSRIWNRQDDPRTTEIENVAPLTTTLSRDTRDDVLDASHGAFLSHSFSYSPEQLGSTDPYVKYFGQFFKYFPLEPTRRERFTGEILRPRFVYAVGVRLGLARTLSGGVDVPETERFFAGGSTTLRGFAQNRVGPINEGNEAVGGEAMFIINNEVRVPLFSIFDGVGFLDVGNVYNRFGNFSLTDLRESAGVGLRVRTPWFLLRADFGVPLDARDDNESGGRFFFSIGQAF
ncbi:MAG: BamA/TamA family outer membrane protein [Luteitalea sp.]|nr:BamA/TamA family outer membrane protein [Luteitalea sp.]